MSKGRPTDAELGRIYDKEFEKVAGKPLAAPGTAHYKALRKVFLAGLRFGKDQQKGESSE